MPIDPDPQTAFDSPSLFVVPCAAVAARRGLGIALDDGDNDRMTGTADVFDDPYTAAGVGRRRTAGDVVNFVPRP